MRVWTVQNQKSGVGKSTIATMLSVYAEQQGQTTLIVDLGTQTCCADWSKIRGTNSPMVLGGPAVKLRDILLSAQKFGVDLAIVDTVPHSMEDAMLAIREADLIIVPALSGLYDETGLRYMAKLLDLTGTAHKAIGVANLVPTSSVKEDCALVSAQLDKYGIPVCPHHLCFRVAYRRCLAKGQGVTEYRPTDPKAVQEVKELWDYLKGLQPTQRRKRNGRHGRN